MSRTTHVTKEPVVLEGFQAVLKPNRFGYALQCIIDQTMVDTLDIEREELLKWCLSKVENPKRSTKTVEPWLEVSDGRYQIKFQWSETDSRPPVVDAEGNVVTDARTPIYNGSTVKIGFYQKPYVKQDKVTYGTSLKLQGVQIITCNGQAGVDVGNMNEEDVASLFGKTKGFVVDDPNVQAAFDAPANDEEDEF